MTPATAPDVLVFAEAKELLRCSASVLLDGIRAGFIPAFKLGRTWRFYRSQLTALIDDSSDWVTAMKQQQGVCELRGWPMGTIYAVETAPGRVKLGYTTNLRQRLHSIEGHAGQAVLLRSEPGTSKDERRLHDECAAQHIRREHFRNEGRVAEYVAGNFSVNELEPVPVEEKRDRRQHRTWATKDADGFLYHWVVDGQEFSGRDPLLVAMLGGHPLQACEVSP